MRAGCLSPLPTKTSGARSDGPASAAERERQQLFLVYIWVEPERVWQPRSAIKQTIISHLKRRASSQFLCFSQFLGRQRLGPHTSRPIRCCASCCLPLLFFTFYVCLSGFFYLFISAFWVLLFCLLIFVNMGLTSTGRDRPLKQELAIALKTDL